MHYQNEKTTIHLFKIIFALQRPKYRRQNEKQWAKSLDNWLQMATVKALACLNKKYLVLK